MKILFVYPNAGSQLGFNYGVAHLSGALKAAGHETALLQLCEDLAPLPTRAEFQERVRAAAPDVVGFSVVTTQWAYACELAAWARDVVDVPIVCGGIHALAAPEQILGETAFDYLFVGECEDAVCEFVDRLAAGESVEHVRNLGFRRGEQVVLMGDREVAVVHTLGANDYGVFS